MPGGAHFPKFWKVQFPPGYRQVFLPLHRMFWCTQKVSVKVCNLCNLCDDNHRAN